MKLAVAYAYSVKHHLRDENGLDYSDYDGVLPASFRHYDVFESAFDGGSRGPSSMYASYNTVDSKVNRRRSKDSESNGEAAGANSPTSAGQSRHGSCGPTRGPYFHSDSVTTTAAGAQTPLLAGDHHAVQFPSSPYDNKLPLLPLA